MKTSTTAISKYGKIEIPIINNTLDCISKNLKSIDLSGLHELEAIYICNNDISKLNLTDCVSLQRLDCRSTNIKKLDLSMCTKLEELKSDLEDKNIILNNNYFNNLLYKQQEKIDKLENKIKLLKEILSK